MKTLKNIHVLSTCDVIDDNGIQELADTYSVEEHEAPVVIGHPKDNAPAYGWVKNLVAKGSKLYADLEVQDSLYSMLQNELFGKRSVSFYDSSPKRFRHLGFLGAMPPHVKGLEPLNLSEDADIISLDEELEKMTDIKPVVLYALSEVIPGVTAKSFKTEPSINTDGSISGVVSLGEVDYKYNMVEDKQGWSVDTSVDNQETVDLAERVRTLEAQISRNEVISEVKSLHAAKLTPKIISLDDAVDIVANDTTGKVLGLLKNLPDIVDMSESTAATPTEPEDILEFARKLSTNL